MTASAQNLPFFSIIIPTYNRPESLTTCLCALLELDYPADRFEAVVVDDGSARQLDDVVAAFRDRLDITLLRQANAGPAAARNAGAARAKGEFLVFLDDDCASPPHWLQRLANRFRQTPTSAIGGHTFNALPDNLYSAASQELIDYLYAHYNSERACFLTANNLALPADQFRDIDGFDASYTRTAAEDRELCDRWLRRGYPMAYAPEIEIHHSHPLSLSAFWWQHFTYGRGALHFREMSARRSGSPLRVEPLVFYLRLLQHPFSRAEGGAAPWLFVLMLLSQGATAAGFFWEKIVGFWNGRRPKAWKGEERAP